MQLMPQDTVCIEFMDMLYSETAGRYTVANVTRKKLAVDSTLSLLPT